ncbi:protein kinase [Arthrobacter deserti]|uniref:non-specific serine/threonine protein kinase n=1 Tax=Arthrobacter deserti TaxID=1742687 RepID=A0ABX1JLK8_9MICC|nr:protein kinase [Arthrobacter deserti]
MDAEERRTGPADGEDGAEPPRPEAEGLRTVRWLGRGASASVWLVGADDGTEFALKVYGRQDPDPPDAELVLLGGVEHEHLVKSYRRVATNLGPGLLLTFAAGGSLAALVAARGPLSAGGAVTVLTPLGQVLAFLHGQGIVHGDLSPGNVLFTASGKPLLADLGSGRTAGPASPRHGATPGFQPAGAEGGGEDQDIYALAALGWYALTGRVPAASGVRPPLKLLCPSVPPELVELLEEGLDEDPGRRPSAAEFASRVYRCAAAEPLDLAGAVHPSVSPRLLTRRQVQAPERERLRRRRAADRTRTAGGRRDPGQLLLAGTALTAALGLAIALGGMLAGGPAPRAGASAAPATAQPPAPAGSAALPTARPVPGRIAGALESPDPAAALAGLAWLRTEAIRTRNEGLLQDVNQAGSPAMRADRKVIAALKSGDSWLSGLEASVEAVELVAASGTEAVLSAVVTTSAFQQHSGSGGLVRKVAAPKQQQLKNRLERGGGRWLIRDVLPPRE